MAPYKGAKQLYPHVPIKSADLDPDLKPDYVLDITTRTNFEDGFFDCIICLEVLEHTRNPFEALKEMYRLLSPAGLLMISLPCNYRMHSPIPDSWRFTHHAYMVIAEDFGFEVLELKCIEMANRLMFPLHYTCIMKKK